MSSLGNRRVYGSQFNTPCKFSQDSDGPPIQVKLKQMTEAYKEYVNKDKENQKIIKKKDAALDQEKADYQILENSIDPLKNQLDEKDKEI